MMEITWSDLELAISDNSPFAEWYLDTATGECIFVSDDISFDEEDEQDVFAEMEQNPERFIAIEPISSKEAYRLMERFIANLGEHEAAQVLAQAITQKRAFFQFKDRLHDFPEVREQWFAFNSEQLKAYAEAWLNGLDVAFSWKTEP